MVTWSWNWQSDDHDLKLIVDPDNTSPETSEANNSLEIRTNGITVGFWVEQSIYDYFPGASKRIGNRLQLLGGLGSAADGEMERVQR